MPGIGIADSGFDSEEDEDRSRVKLGEEKFEQIIYFTVLHLLNSKKDSAGDRSLKFFLRNLFMKKTWKNECGTIQRKTCRQTARERICCNARDKLVRYRRTAGEFS
ncbi:hypothetical protein BT96DRAFT_157595 [Gymnopus androsaceus JB14]|uniref:Uncharacterized protein n=1 Tax=Gymnopus androsaceus JB14 TaxID=1447944 RepID=A0A6A4GBU2_9AGAR|nr:hypothetical protein BT96DRAFT_157595 [Gymnopus androsaceus JB14]